MTFLCIQLYDAVKNAGGIPLVDEFFKAASEDLLGKDGKSELINETKENVSFAYDDFINEVTRGCFCEDADGIDCADLEAALVDLNDSLSTGWRNLQKPNNQRWGTMLPAIKMVIKHFAHFYALAVLVKKSEAIKRKRMKSSGASYIVKVADDLLSLMKMRADPDDFDCPGSLYTQLLFLDGIGDWFYAWMLNGVMGHNY